jgi:ribosome-associated protein
VKGQNIVVFNTEHLSPLFERVIIASGTSNRQTKSLASSVRDAVKARGLPAPRTEGEENGEWIIVDCGAAVVHVMQPAIRDYYHLEEIWGGKPVKLKIDTTPVRLVKASAEPAAKASKKSAAPKPTAKKAAAKAPATKRAPAKKAVPQAKKAAPAKKAGAKAPARKAAAPAKPPAHKAPARKAPARTTVTRTVGVKRAPGAAKKAPVRKSTRG